MIEFELKLEGFEELGNRLDRFAAAQRIIVNNGLRRIGGQGVPILKGHTPIGATSNLRNKTVFQIREMGMEQMLQFRQGARSRDFFYGRAVRGGRRPGRMPPVEALIPWVRAKLHVSEARVRGVAFVVARAIGRRGTKPNPYHVRALQAMMPNIRAAITDMGRRLAEFIAGR